MRSSGGTLGSVSVQVGQDWWTHLSTYEDYPPILSIDAGSMSVTFSVSGNEANPSAVDFARELARQTARFAAEVERLHALRDHDAGTGEDGAAGGRGALMMTAGGAAGTGIPAAPGVSPSWRKRRGAESNGAR